MLLTKCWLATLAWIELCLHMILKPPKWLPWTAFLFDFLFCRVYGTASGHSSDVLKTGNREKTFKWPLVFHQSARFIKVDRFVTRWRLSDLATWGFLQAAVLLSIDQFETNELPFSLPVERISQSLSRHFLKSCCAWFTSQAYIRRIHDWNMQVVVAFLVIQRIIARFWKNTLNHFTETYFFWSLLHNCVD